MRKWTIRLLVMIGILVVVLLLRLTVFAPKPVEVRVVVVERGQVESIVTNSKAGTVKAGLRSRLSPETGGRVVELPYREGAQVKAGDVLLKLDDSSQRAQLIKARRDLITAEANRKQTCLAADQAQRELRRNSKLAEQEIVSQNMLDRLRNQAEGAAAACVGAEAMEEGTRAAVSVMKVELGKTALRAPFDGVVSELSVELGEWTTPSPPAMQLPPVIEIIGTSSIYISAPMDEVDSARIRADQPVRVTLDPYPDQTFAGVVTRVAPYVLDIEAQNRTVEIEVRLEDEELATTLLPGASADVEVVLEVRDDVLRIPTSTLMEGNAVLVVENGKLVRRPVETGLRNWDLTEIVSGLESNEQIVANLDRADIQPGARVRIVTDTEGAGGE